jgi:hypothetical protein
MAPCDLTGAKTRLGEGAKPPSCAAGKAPANLGGQSPNLALVQCANERELELASNVLACTDCATGPCRSVGCAQFVPMHPYILQFILVQPS